MPKKILSRAYYRQPTLQVARDLLGKHLVRAGGNGLLSGRIIEVEAYVGPEDRASHASRGRTKRTEVMFGRAGIAYVYLIYGMYHCLNVVTEREGYPAAILIRAVEVEVDGGLVGVGGARLAGPPPTLIDGPGRLCRHFEISREQNCHDLTLGENVWLEDRGERIAQGRIVAAPRIGVDYAGVWAAKPWRFRLKGADG
ncbi:MAG: DNA-3-methyladenine glycosylase [Nitrospirae bacterium]|nr:DNA-3-methyladenine glycosylase [Nitrospirota bacterium]